MFRSPSPPLSFGTLVYSTDCDDKVLLFLPLSLQACRQVLFVSFATCEYSGLVIIIFQGFKQREGNDKFLSPRGAFSSRMGHNFMFVSKVCIGIDVLRSVFS